MHGRPLATRESMHLVLRSTQAKGEWSFRRPKNAKNICAIVEKFGLAYGVRLISMANVGNHLHMQIRLANRFTNNAFIRAITGAIAMSVTGRNCWTKQAAKKSINVNGSNVEQPRGFWDQRPFTRIVQSFRAYLKLTFESINLKATALDARKRA